MNVDDLILNLKIISKIPENGKLKRDGGNLAIETNDSYYNTFSRTLRRDSRNKAVSDIEKTISLAIDKASSIINSKNFNDSSVDYRNNHLILEMINNELTRCIRGLSNFKTTYYSDSTICSKIDILIMKIDDFVKFINENI